MKNILLLLLLLLSIVSCGNEKPEETSPKKANQKVQELIGNGTKNKPIPEPSKETSLEREERLLEKEKIKSLIGEIRVPKEGTEKSMSQIEEELLKQNKTKQGK